MAAVAPIARHGQVGESGAARTDEAAQPSPSGPSDRRAVALAASVAVGARWPHLVGDWRLWAILAGSTFLWSRVSARHVVGFVVVAAVAFAVAANLADRANEGLQWRRSTAYVGWATVARDPDPTPFGGRVELRIAHRRVLAAGNGPPGWALLRLAAGERVSVSGTVQVLRPVPGWLRARHIGARLNVRAVLGRRVASQPWRSVNALRRVLLDGGRVLPKRQQPLYGGFILGDDRGQRPEITDDFRGSGLSHLLVVSGQNVAFLFIAARPILRRFAWRGRFGVGLVLLVGFLFATRFEPSVLRAVAMAGVTLLADAKGVRVAPLRVLAIAVTGLVLVDPLLVWSVGFGLSVGACLGIAVLAKPIRRVLRGPSWWTEPMAITIAAQIGTAPFLIGIFGGLPLVSLPANLLALPAAEPVMVWGLTGGLVAGLTAGWYHGLLAKILHFPTRLLLAWVSGVARVAAWAPIGAIHGPLAVGFCLVLLALFAFSRAGAVADGNNDGNGDAGAKAGANERVLDADVQLPTDRAGPSLSLSHPTPHGYFSGTRRVPRRLGEALLAVVVIGAIAAPSARFEPPVEDRRLDGGGRLWRTGGHRFSTRTTVVSLRRPRLDRLLPELRSRGVGRIDVLVVGAKMPLDDLRAVLARVPTGLVLAPLRAKLLTASPRVHEVPVGARARVGPFLVRIGRNGEAEVSFLTGTGGPTERPP